MACSLLHGSTAMARHQLAPYLEQSGEVSLVSGEVSLEDFAFADTVAVQDLPTEATPVSYRDPYPTILDDVRLPARPGSLRAWLAFYEWQREDVLRAAWIGLAMLVLIATVSAVALTR